MSAERKHTDAESLFKDIARFVADSRTLLGTGQMMELGGLDMQVKKLCEKVLALSPEDRAEYADLLADLLGQLQTLGADMQTQKEALVNEIRYLSSHKKATVAYKSADATDGGKKEDE